MGNFYFGLMIITSGYFKVISKFLKKPNVPKMAVC